MSRNAAHPPLPNPLPQAGEGTSNPLPPLPLAGEGRGEGKPHRRAFWMLFFIAAPLAEILSGNMPLLKFFTPPAFVAVTLFYGLPVVLIRELVVAKKLNVLGIVVLSLGYGLLNEGVLAKTLTELSGQPVGPFAGYGRTGPFQWGWAIFIVFWHAMHSVLYPILITHWAYPASATQRWFSPRGLKVALLLFAALYPLHFILHQRPAYPVIFIAYIIATVLFALIAVRFCKQRDLPPVQAGWKPPLKPFFIGLCAVVFYALHYVMAAKRVLPFAGYTLFSVGIICFAAWRMAKARWRPVPEMLLFGLGDDLSFSLWAGLGTVATHNAPVQHGIAAVAFFFIFIYLVRAVRRMPAGRVATQPQIQGETT
ncbi:MAG: hypothetical protein GC185_00480 [Alphaproteobacteria bacterium]|nr:hypothetical protein [Alphaproteobacteria bacterium]